ncbi:TPA: hypothetical protein ACN3ZQ_001075 [Vibrio cholerae]|jgi:hypothetical protein
MSATKLNHRVGCFEHEIPKSFVDDSNGNDVCASIYSEDLKVKVFIDHINPEEREEPSYARFAIHKTNEFGETEDLVLESESWEEILDLIRI